eukprot:1148559-Pelagomonas_calceolata.AAC.2
MTQRTSVAKWVRQLHQLNANQQHVHLIEIKYCEDTRPGKLIEAAQQQHADLSKKKGKGKGKENFPAN